MPERRSDDDPRRGALQQLQDLIAALDRRLPHVERAGESEIARDAEALRTKALARIAEIEAEEPDA